MKQCPKCGTEHNKSGTFCSRSCANSRVFSDDAKHKKSIALKGKKLGSRGGLSKEAFDAKVEKYKKVVEERLLTLPFDSLGIDRKRRRVLEEQKYCCARCGLFEWMGKKLTLELEHKDGNNQNNVRENLEGLCPNCHSLTETWRGRNKPAKNGVNKVSDELLRQCLNETESIRQGLLKAGIAAKGGNYVRAKKLLGQ